MLSWLKITEIVAKTRSSKTKPQGTRIRNSLRSLLGAMSMLAPVAGDEEGSLKPAMGAFNDCKLSSESLKEGTVAPLTLVGGASGCPDWNARVNKACKPRESGACDDDLRATRHRLPPPCIMVITWKKYAHFNGTKCNPTHAKWRVERIGEEECECRTRFLESEKLDWNHTASFAFPERQQDGCERATERPAGTPPTAATSDADADAR